MQRLGSVLTVAGSDSGGGAGIQADLKTISMLGGYGASVITALTAQNTCTVTGIHAPPAEFVAEQMKAVLDDIQIDAIKTGMLFSAPIMEAVAPYLKAFECPVVVDPVCVAQSGAKLLEDDAVDAMVEHIFPLATLLTPNIPEAELFAKMTIKSQDDIFAAAEKLLTMGPKAVLIKGGHMEGMVAATDWYAEPGKKPIPLIQPKVDTTNNHGTGCTLSAAIATGLAKGLDIIPAIRAAQSYLNLALRASYSIGECSGPPNHIAPLLMEQERPSVLDAVDRLGRRMIGASGLGRIVPRQGTNIVAALRFAADVSDFAAFSGGIYATRGNEIVIAGHPVFGASRGLAQGMVMARRHLPRLRLGILLRRNEDVLSALDKAGIGIIDCDLSKMPAHADLSEGMWEEWVVGNALESLETAEEIIAVGNEGHGGREGLVRIMAADESVFLEKICALLDCLGLKTSC